MVIDKSKLDINKFDYDLPDSRIAKYPLAERDKSKLLINNEGQISHSVFSNISKLLPSDSLLISNNTKVIQARLHFTKNTGATIEIFCLEPYDPVDYNLAFAAQNKCRWVCLVGNLKKWKEGGISATISVNGSEVIVTAYREDTKETGHIIRFEWSCDNILFGQILENAGQLPIPPYLNRNTEASDLERYQTIYSKIQGSVAAPTAGLHFTPHVFKTLEHKGIKSHEVTLHVGAGTFRPVKTDNAADHSMHSEHFVIKRIDIELLLKYEGNITVVGTTSVRTIESMYWLGVKQIVEQNSKTLILDQWDAYNLPQHYSVEESFNALLNLFNINGVDELIASTGIMIVPGYKFRLVKRLITNFHQPKSTLLLLIAAFTGDSWKQMYNYAMENNFRFLSYGDSCLLIN